MAAYIGGVMVAPICIRAAAAGAVLGYTAEPDHLAAQLRGHLKEKEQDAVAAVAMSIDA
jgi:hypothetical protein